MTDEPHQRPALGQPAGQPADPAVLDEPDIAGEHEDTAVDKRITGGNDPREPESPDGLGGMDPDA
jgi:hypothetical protein